MAKQSDPKTKIIKLLVLIILCLVAVLTLLLFPTALWKAGTQVVDRTAVGEYGDRTIRRAAELPPGRSRNRRFGADRAVQCRSQGYDFVCR